MVRDREAVSWLSIPEEEFMEFQRVMIIINHQRVGTSIRTTPNILGIPRSTMGMLSQGPIIQARSRINDLVEC